MNNNSNQFINKDDQNIIDRFLDNGFIIEKSDNKENLDLIRDLVVDLSCKFLKTSVGADKNNFLDNIHNQVDVQKINELRLYIFQNLNKESWVRKCYFELAKNTLEVLVGNELAMQKKINLSIQMPDDETSVLPVHADVWSGDSPFEIVLWVPFVDVNKSKSMFILPTNNNKKHINIFQDTKIKNSSELMERIRPDLTWLELKYGEILIFTQNLMHGNEINKENSTRFSMNCRFKSLFSPYSDKKIGEFFEPITMKPATRLGLDYLLPKIN